MSSNFLINQRVYEEILRLLPNSNIQNLYITTISTPFILTIMKYILNA